MESTMNSMREDIIKLRRDVELIKRMLMSQRKDEDEEGELTDWAKDELKKARDEDESNYTSLENVKKKIMKK